MHVLFDCPAVYEYSLLPDGMPVVSAWGPGSTHALYRALSPDALELLIPDAVHSLLAPVAGGGWVAFQEEAPDQHNLLRLGIYDLATRRVLYPAVCPLPQSQKCSLAWLGPAEVVTVDLCQEVAWLTRICVDAHSSPERIAPLPGGRHWIDPQPSVRPDGTMVLMARGAAGRQVMILQPGEPAPRLLLPANRSAEPLAARWIPGGERVVVLVRRGRRLELVLLDSGRKQIVPLRLPAVRALPACHADGRQLAITVDAWPGSSLAIHDLETQSLTPIPLTEGLMGESPQWHGDSCFFIGYAADRPPALWCWPGGADPAHPRTRTERLTTLSTPTVLALPSPEGFQIPCLLYEPKGKEVKGTVLMLHGGPSAAWRIGWSPFIAALCLNGYRVVLINTRGSTGAAGWHLPPVSPGHFGESEAADLGACLEALAHQGLVAAGRVGVVGHSHGAFVAYQAALRFPDYVRAAVLTSSYLAPADLLLTQDEAVQRFSAFAFPSAQAAAAPATLHAPCPILMVHGEHDFQIPAHVAQTNLARLQGAVKRLLLLPNEGHAFKLKSNVKHWMAEAILFFHVHLAERKSHDVFA